MNFRYLTLVIALAIACPSVGWAQEGKSWWNPFSSSSSSSTTRESSQFGSSSSASAFKMPEFKMPWSNSKPTIKKKKPSMMSRATSTSKKWWDNTVDFMNPFDDKPAAKTNGYQPQKQTKSGKGMFGWMSKEETTETPASLQNWLSNPRPGFDQ